MTGTKAAVGPSEDTGATTVADGSRAALEELRIVIFRCLKRVCNIVGKTI
jgi:hypothetical protein